MKTANTTGLIRQEYFFGEMNDELPCKREPFVWQKRFVVVPCFDNILTSEEVRAVPPVAIPVSCHGAIPPVCTIIE